MLTLAALSAADRAAVPVAAPAEVVQVRRQEPTWRRVAAVASGIVVAVVGVVAAPLKKGTRCFQAAVALLP